MAGELIATRYARALFDLAESLDKAQAYLQQLNEINQVFDDEAIERVLKSPVVGSDLKKDVLTALGRQVDVDQVLEHFLDIIAEANRVALLPMVATQLKTLIYEKTGTQEATIVTALELNQADLADIKAKLDEITGKNTLVTKEIDATILGGFVIRIENSVLDMSLKSKLDAITQTAAS